MTEHDNCTLAIVRNADPDTRSLPWLNPKPGCVLLYPAPSSPIVLSRKLLKGGGVGPPAVLAGV
jgi:hypothetical protein